jgi:hypothetical protein
MPGLRAWMAVCLLAVAGSEARADTRTASPVRADLGHYSPDCGVRIRQEGSRLVATWPMAEKESGRLVLDLTPGQPLIAGLGISQGPKGKPVSLLTAVEPAFFLTVGQRTAPKGRPPEMSPWNVFFDRPAKKPYRTYRSQLDLKSVKVSSRGRRATITLGNLDLGPFKGELLFTLYAGSRVVHAEAVVSTREDRHAILYDAGLVGEAAGWRRLAWFDTEGKLQQSAVDTPAQTLAVRYRTIAAESEHGAVACFPPPHQFHFPRDWTDNLKFVWYGKGYRGLAKSFGFGVRQEPDGKRAFEPWFNAPPGTRQRLGVFYLLTLGRADEALREVLRFTHGDHFKALPGYITFTSHWHMAVAVTAMNRKKQTTPDLVRVFKEMGVNAVHLADFHGDGHQKDAGPLRLPELEMLFRECSRLSDRDFLLIPGEEVNEFLGLRQPGKHPGHWMSLFPRPVFWIQRRGPGQPFVENHPRHGRVYRVGSREDMVELIKREKALVWAAHPRIKASSWTPDIFRKEDFYLAGSWLGGAWKAMPADLSRSRLGTRCLDLLNDMANWGQKKYLPGEVDVFKIDHTHELYGHMNINYVQLDRLPRFEQGWQPILDALSAGRFFVTTGEILLQNFQVGSKQSGQTLKLKPGERSELTVDLEWTFPLQFAEVISGDGQKVYRERIDLSDTGPFGKRTLKLRPDLHGRIWVRFEVWDVAVNGAFTQPVWLE